MWRAVASKQQLSDISELPWPLHHQVSLDRAANQTPSAHAMVGKRAVAGKAAAQWDQSALQGVWPEILALTTPIKHPGMKLNQIPPSPHSLHCLSVAARKTPMASRKSAGKTNWDAQPFLFLQALLCLSRLRTLPKSTRHEHFVLQSFFSENPFIYWTETRAAVLWEGAGSLP